MATFTIKFEGLIMHYGPDAQTKKHAVVVDDRPPHMPLVIVPGAEVIPKQGAPLIVELYDGDTITFDDNDLNPGVATCDPTFTTLVPRLKNLVRGTIRGTVEAAMHAHGDGAVTFLTFPEGTLSAPETLDHPLKFYFPSDSSDHVFVIQHCVAAGVLFTATPISASVHMTIRSKSGSSRVIHMLDSATMELVNLSDGGAHFEKYVGLMSPESKIAKAEEIKGEFCNESALASTIFTRKLAHADAARRHTAAVADAQQFDPMSSPNPECSNSAWP